MVSFNYFSSSLTRKLLAINIIALFALFFSIFFLNTFEDSLREEKGAALQQDAEFFAKTIEFSSFYLSQRGKYEINVSVVQHILKQFSTSTTTRIQYFDIEGKEFIDTAKFQKKQFNNAKNSSHNWLIFIINFLNHNFFSVDSLSQSRIAIDDNSIKNGFDFPEVLHAMEGQSSYFYRQNKKGHFIFSAASPIIKDEEIRGILLLTESGLDVDQKIMRIQTQNILLFFIVLFFTLLFSIYYAFTIASPLQRLSKYSTEIEKGIPDYKISNKDKNRKDEIGQLFRSFEKMSDSIWNRIDVIERFAADVSHEIKNPLTSIRSAMESLASQTDEDKKKKLSQLIFTDLNRLTKLINEISEASKIDAEMAKISFKPIMLDEFIKNIEQIFTSLPNKCSLDLNIPKQMKLNKLYLEGNAIRLYQVFENILGNAISFSPKGASIKLSLQKYGNIIKVYIEDEGPGINNSEFNKIFERFYSNRPKGQYEQNHSGLGLNIAKQIVEAHGGSINVDNKYINKKRSGAIFCITLPLIN